MEENILRAVSIPLSLAFMWVLYFWLYRTYRVDKFRNSVFSLRDSLFDLALAGTIPFNHPAYILLRTTLNGAIRFGHRFGLVGLGASIWGRGKEPTNYESVWNKATEGLSLEVKDALDSIRVKFHLAVLAQIIATSPILIGAIVPLLVWLVGYCVYRVSAKAARKLANAFLRLPLINGITQRYDSAALCQAR